MGRLLPCFQEQCFSQNQVVFKAAEDHTYVHLLAEGDVKLVTNTNPFSNTNVNPAAADQKTDNEGNKVVQNSVKAGQGTISQSLSQNQLGYV